MSRRGNISKSRCQGESLPQLSERIDCPVEATALIDCCNRLTIGDSRLLYDGTKKLSGGRPTHYYWLTLEADTMPLRLCEFDRFADKISSIDARWVGRKPNYLAMGWSHGDCYVVFLELRAALVNQGQADDKFEQLEQGMQMLCKQEDEEANQIHGSLSELLDEVCEGITSHNVVGIAVPVSHSKSRAEQTRQIQVGEKEIILVSISHRQDCSWTWSGLLRAIGL